jgi:hypothetical protein
VAALFNPLRHRVQRVVDRRFNRSKYDHEQVASAFSADLQGRVNTEELVLGWVGVVSETMQPGSIAVWLRSP